MQYDFPRLVTASILGLATVSAAGCPINIFLDEDGTTAGTTVASTITDGDSNGGNSPTTGPDSPTTGGSEPSGPLEVCQAEWDAASAILKGSCAACHHDKNDGGFDIVLDPVAMIQSPKKYIKPGDPDGSALYTKIDSGLMPKDNAPLPEAQQSTIKSFIECLAPAEGDPTAAPNCPPGLHVTPAMALEWIRDDASKLDLEDKLNARYLSLWHLKNAGVCPEAIQTYTHALNKLINSLSRKNVVSPLTPVKGSDGLVLRLDQSDYGISSARWHDIACANPFVVDYTGNAQLEDAKAIADDVGESLFVQPGDAFLHITSQGDLYHALLDIPEDLSAFLQSAEQDVLVEIAENEGTVARIGMAKGQSGVAELNRVVEWHQIPGDSDAYCWVSYDMASEAEFENIKLHPLDFKAHANEVICSLPNGLQFYFVALKGLRANEADPDVVKNVEHEGDVVKNGVSCMGCHREGMRDAVDILRDHVFADVDADPELVTGVERLYPPKHEIDPILAVNRSRFKKALADLGVPVDIKTTAGTWYEPIFLCDLAFDEQPIDIHRVAAELGVTVDAVQQILQQVGLDGLINDGTIDRSTFETAFSLAIEKLNKGDAQPLQSCIPG